jgi:hypothetical protein
MSEPPWPPDEDLPDGAEIEPPEPEGYVLAGGLGEALRARTLYTEDQIAGELAYAHERGLWLGVAVAGLPAGSLVQLFGALGGWGPLASLLGGALVGAGLTGALFARRARRARQRLERARRGE